MGSSYQGGNAPHLVLLSVRLPSDLAPLAPAIVRNLERDAATASRK